MAVFANDHIGVTINQFGYFEHEELMDLFEYFSPLHDEFRSSVALDIGANIGNHSIFFSEFFLSVHAFEPNPSTFELLKFNSRSVSNIVPHNLGLGDVSGSFELAEDPTNMGLSSLKYLADGQHTSVSIVTERLDDIELNVKSLALVKIDVEGYEANVIKGAMSTLKTMQPLVVLEQHESEFENGATPSIRLLQEIGYSFCWHEAPSENASWWRRRARDLREVLLGRDSVVSTSDVIPKRNYTMLIAVPPRFRAALGFSENNN